MSQISYPIASLFSDSHTDLVVGTGGQDVGSSTPAPIQLLGVCSIV